MSDSGFISEHNNSARSQAQEVLDAVFTLQIKNVWNQDQQIKIKIEIKYHLRLHPFITSALRGPINYDSQYWEKKSDEGAVGGHNSSKKTWRNEWMQPKLVKRN